MDKAKAMIEADNNRSFVVDVFDAGSNQKVISLARAPCYECNYYNQLVHMKRTK